MHRPFLALLITTPSLVLAQGDAQMPWWQRAPEGTAGHYAIKTDLPKEQARSIARHLNVMY